MKHLNPRIYLSSPHMGGEEIDYIREAFDTNWIAPLGANVDGFEKDIQQYIGSGVNAAVVTSGTAAIHLALILCGVEAGDEVICQSLTFSASANPIRYLNATPVFVDSEPETWNMDPELLEQAITDRIRQNAGKKPKAIIVVDLYGMPAKMDQILKVADSYGIPIIEDAAEALGASINGRMCGSFGKLSILSFNGNKIITTSGGGAVLSVDKELAAKARFLATQARDKAPHYQHSQLGYNYRMSNIVAGIGRGQMKVLEKRVTQRRAVFEYYFTALGSTWFEVEGQKSKVLSEKSEVKNDLSSSTLDVRYGSPTGFYFLKEPEGFFSNRWLTTILVIPEQTGGITREDLRQALEEENIECRPLWKPMHLQPLYQSFPYYGQGVSDMLFEYGLCLPSGSNLTDKECERIVKLIKKHLHGKNKLSAVSSTQY